MGGSCEEVTGPPSTWPYFLTLKKFVLIYAQNDLNSGKLLYKKSSDPIFRLVCMGIYFRGAPKVSSGSSWCLEPDGAATTCRTPGSGNGLESRAPQLKKNKINSTTCTEVDVSKDNTWICFHLV